MGIKGIYKEIGPGKRISLTKLAIQKLEESGRPLRIAIDISIWQFQVQAARGGSNPAIRTLFYRLLRLLSLSIQPIFIFDGPNKPVFKRNKRSGRGDGVATAMAKRLIRLFGFIAHDAPGEAEAECALLQQSGIVDAVLSEDVDTIMFGCTQTLRNWSSEGTRGSKTPTHVSVYDRDTLVQGTSGLDREGMVLVALMSGGDYLPEGIPGAGVKLACEAARAGFGRSLCRLKRSDVSELNSWKEWLAYELRHNESGFFRTRHKALNVPDDFPNMDVLRYYTHPVVSPASVLERLKSQSWDRVVDVQGLREFVRETFDWNYRIGAIKFIRVLAPCLLVRKLMQRSTTENSNDAEGEDGLVRSITSRRTHFSTDSTSELRISFIPTEVVGYDFQDEPDEIIDFGRDGLALNSDDEMEELAAGGEGEMESPTKSKPKKPFNPVEPDLVWMSETIAKLGTPLMVESWENAQRAKEAARSRPKTSRQKSKAGSVTAGALDKFMRVTKNNMLAEDTIKSKASSSEPAADISPTRTRSPLDPLPGSWQGLPPSFSSSQGPRASQLLKSSKAPSTRSKTRSSKKLQDEPKADADVNPWTIASSQRTPKASRSTKVPEAILISSSPPASPATPTRSPINSSNKTLHPSEPDPFSSPTSHRSLTPVALEFGRPDSSILSTGRGLSPSSTERPQRKLARTESLPVGPSTRSSHSSEEPQLKTRGFTRAQTIAIETLPLDSEDEDEGEDDDFDFDLPPIENIINRLPQSKSKSNPYTISSSSNPPATQPQLNDHKKKKQTTLYDDNDGETNVRMTKLYVPRKSDPGFFKEIDVPVDDVESLKEQYAATGSGSGSRSGNGNRGGLRAAGTVWRRSDISCIDLTGED
ncbi:hypothetical protein F5Y16DRAFT_258909 [Xylariaceae sp. FL0255]|nr:hypothetical protein F5Y16DRAFT_258909 [Xylariaceae sp. FL0255]